MNAIDQMRHHGLQMLALPLGQLGRKFEDVVTLGQLIEGFERQQQIAGKFAGTGAGLGHDGGAVR